jgi:hypothetical protein
MGRKLVEEFLPTVDLTHLIDPSGLPLAGHGTGGLIVFGRHRPPVSGAVRAVLRVRDEPGHPDDPRRSLVWTSILDLLDSPGEENIVITVLDLDRSRLARHPWTLGGGGALELKERIDLGRPQLGNVVKTVGVFGMSNADEVLLADLDTLRRYGIESSVTRQAVTGEDVRDWMIGRGDFSIFPYGADGLRDLGDLPGTARRLWPFRTTMGNRATFSKRTYFEEGRPWWAWHQVALDRLAEPPTLCFASISTHNHFGLDRGGRVFKQSAPIVKLNNDSEEAHVHLLALLNSSMAGFWLRQVMYPKSGDGVGRGIQDEEWETRFDADTTKLKQFPVAVAEFDEARVLIQLSARYQELESIETSETPSRSALESRSDELARIQTRMITAQEELDWKVYALYGLVSDDLMSPLDLTPDLHLGQRSFEIALARRIRDEGLETAWFERHGSKPEPDIPDNWPVAYRTIVSKRLAAIENDRDLSLLERPECKRRWAFDDWPAARSAILRAWLQRRLEEQRYWHPPVVTTCARLAESVRRDSDFMQVAELYAGADFDIVRLVSDLVTDEAVPYLAAYRYKEPGLRKRADWERTWELQRAEDEIDARTALQPEDPGFLTTDQADTLKRQEVGAIPVPPKYVSSDFVKTTYWKQRGKLDVPRERFISHPDAERENDPTLVIGWAGWGHLERAQALAAWYTEARDSGVDRERLVPMLAGLWELVPWLRQWHNDVDPAFGERLGDFFASFTTEQAGALGRTTEDLSNWRPPAPVRGRRRS